LGQKITPLAGQINEGSHFLLTLIAEFELRKGWNVDALDIFFTAAPGLEITGVFVMGTPARGNG